MFRPLRTTEREKRGGGREREGAGGGGGGQGNESEVVMKSSDRELDQGAGAREELSRAEEAGKTVRARAPSGGCGGENERSLRAFVFEFYSRR